MSYLESSTLYAHAFKEKESYLRILELILSKEVFDKDGTMIIYKKDSCLFYNGVNSSKKNKEKYFEFKYGENIVNVWPGDSEIIDDIKNYIRVNHFDILKDEAQINLELYIDHDPLKKRSIHLKKKKNDWKIV